VINEARRQLEDQRKVWREAQTKPADWQTLNRAHEADAELIPLPGGDLVLATTIDTIAEEISLGFFKSPETIGWMGGAVSLSDLAAVGAAPLGLVVSVTLPRGATPEFQAGIARGLDAACRAAGTFVLGGDTNSGDAAHITTAGIGVVPRGRVMTRVGCKAGDIVYATGPLGMGGAVAARALLDLPADLFAEADFRPTARVREASVIASFASSCIDTSDALVAALDQLARLNGVGFDIDAPLDALIAPRALAVAKAVGVDPLVLLAQHHGEFELVFTIPAARDAAFNEATASAGVVVLRLGVATGASPSLRFIADRPRQLDGARVRNLLDEVGGDVRVYLAALIDLVRGA
jgi:thiamine-monophosphate kinase